MTDRAITVVTSEGADADAALRIERLARDHMPGFHFSEKTPVRPTFMLACMTEEGTQGIPAGDLDDSVVAAAAVLRYPTKNMPRSVPFSISRPAPSDSGDHASVAGMRMLLRAAQRLADSWGMESLSTWLPLSEHDTDEMQFWSLLGFARPENERVRHYRSDLQRMIDLLEPLYARLQARGRIPAGARVIPLSRAPKGPVIQLQMEFLGGRAGYLDQRLRGQGMNPFDPELSQVLLVEPAGRETSVDDAPSPEAIHAGHMLILPDHAGLMVAEARVVAPAYRGGWVNVLLLMTAARVGVAAGYTEFRFAAGQSHKDTHVLADHLTGGRGTKDPAITRQESADIRVQHWIIPCRSAS